MSLPWVPLQQHFAVFRSFGEQRTYAIASPEMQDSRIAFHGPGLEEAALEEGPQVVKGAIPFVRGLVAFGARVGLVPELFAAQFRIAV